MYESQRSQSSPTAHPVQRAESRGASRRPDLRGRSLADQQAALSPDQVAAQGVRGGGGELPHLQAIQASFGRHDVSGVRAHVGGQAADAASAIGARAYATGDAVAFAEAPDLHTAAHEAAHVVQQRGGVSLLGRMGKAGDRYEAHADAVADLVVAGQSAESLLDPYAGGGGAASGGQVQRLENIGLERVVTQEPLDGGVAHTGDPDAGTPMPADRPMHTRRNVIQAGTDSAAETQWRDLARRNDDNARNTVGGFVRAVTMSDAEWQREVSLTPSIIGMTYGSGLPTVALERTFRRQPGAADKIKFAKGLYLRGSAEVAMDLGSGHLQTQMNELIAEVQPLLLRATADHGIAMGEETARPMANALDDDGRATMIGSAAGTATEALARYVLGVSADNDTEERNALRELTHAGSVVRSAANAQEAVDAARRAMIETIIGVALAAVPVGPLVSRFAARVTSHVAAAATEAATQTLTQRATVLLNETVKNALNAMITSGRNSLKSSLADALVSGDPNQRMQRLRTALHQQVYDLNLPREHEQALLQAVNDGLASSATTSG